MIKRIQINLRHSRTAFVALALTILDLNVDVALIQEPYAFSATSSFLVNIPSGLSPIHQLTDDHAYGAAILVWESLLSQAWHPTPAFLAWQLVLIFLRSGTLKLCSVYLRPSLDYFHYTTSQMFENFASPRSILCVDSNAKSLLWNSQCNDFRGFIMEDLIPSH